METYTYNGYTLTVEESNNIRNGKVEVEYSLTSPSGEVIFNGSDFYASPLHSATGKESAGSLLSFLTLRPGDTDSEYFDKYTPRQWEFVENEAEELSLWAMELEEM